MTKGYLVKDIYCLQKIVIIRHFQSGRLVSKTSSFDLFPRTCRFKFYIVQEPYINLLMKSKIFKTPARNLISSVQYRKLLWKDFDSPMFLIKFFSWTYIEALRVPASIFYWQSVEHSRLVDRYTEAAAKKHQNLARDWHYLKNLVPCLILKSLRSFCYIVIVFMAACFCFLILPINF